MTPKYLLSSHSEALDGFRLHESCGGNMERVTNALCPAGPVRPALTAQHWLAA